MNKLLYERFRVRDSKDSKIYDDQKREEYLLFGAQPMLTLCKIVPKSVMCTVQNFENLTKKLTESKNEDIYVKLALKRPFLLLVEVWVDVSWDRMIAVKRAKIVQ